MDRAAIHRPLDAARDLTHHRDFVIIGSLSVLVSDVTPPDSMLMSADGDL